jgi:aquaporin related protein
LIVYWLGPALGSVVAAGFYKFIKLLEYETANPEQDSDVARLKERDNRRERNKEHKLRSKEHKLRTGRSLSRPRTARSERTDAGSMV